MTDYGHDLMFGTFVTPIAQPVQHAVQQAVLADRLGLDLVTFQDHPYVSRFHDTWTLIPYAAARTERVRLTANVTNLPLRFPAQLARSVATLDRLTGGRIELGLGAGGFWDAIEAMGGRRLRPGEALTALEEGVQIIRGVWDTSTPGGLTVDGKFHAVRGAKRGPAPAHRPSIWIGGYKPRMLRTIGTIADGWLPSAQNLRGGIEDLARGSEIIDEAAESAGRRPQDVRRLLNLTGDFDDTSRGFLQGPPDQWVEELTDLALTYGTSVFILFSDDPGMTEVFAKEVAPAVRDEVRKARGTTS
jgi:alkanesulfonate monooxygenase SsuD/methylene tetrahydromethanopterin reductase-like flavin-dependent oxidoreductase (luciferase family)